MKKYLKYALVFGIIKKSLILIFLFSNYSFGQQSKVYFNLSLKDKPEDLTNWYASYQLSVWYHAAEMGYDPDQASYLTPDNPETIRFGSLPSGTLAVAQQVNNDCAVDILINRVDWFNTYQQRRMWVYYHEMAHDTFNLNHGEGGELMNPYVPNDKITSLRLYNAIRSMVRYAIKYGKYEKGGGLCENGIIYRRNGTKYVSKKGSVYKDHQSSSSYKRPSSSSSYNRSSNTSKSERRNQAFSHQAIISFYLSKDMKNDTNTIVNKGDKIKVLSCQNGSLAWCKIIYNGVIGYAYKSSLEKL